MDVNPSDPGSWDDQLSAWLTERDAAGLRRRLRVVGNYAGHEVEIDGQRVLHFSTNDYLGLARHPRLVQAAREAAARWGAGRGASRLVGGNLAVQAELDEALAAFKGRPAALTFSTGYAAAVGTVPALVEKGDAVLLDKRAHASLIDGARLSGATLRVFPHNDLDYLEKLLRQSAGARRTLIVTESVFSMDGDTALLREICDLKDKFGKRVWLMVDEAHAVGLYGARRTGLIEAQGLTERVEVQMGTLSKALGSSGGVVSGSRLLIDTLVNRARSLIYSTAPSPAACGAARAALEIVSGEEGAARCARLWKNAAAFTEATGVSSPSPIFPIVFGAEEKAVAASAALAAQGIAVPPIRYPTVARGQARLRVTLTAEATTEQIARLAGALKEVRIAIV
jgi:8-amino-7-oxononanoate synthase